MKFDELVKKRFEELDIALEALRKRGEKQKSGGILYPMMEFQQWATSVMSLLEQIDSQECAYYKKFAQAQVSDRYQRHMEGGDVDKCSGIFRAAKADFLGGYLIRIRSLIEAEVLTDGLEQAEEFLKVNYKDAACIIAGVVLEIAVKDVCARNGIALTKLDAMNGELAKNGIYNKSMQKQITAWAGLRNDGAHGNWQAYTKDQVELMVAGVRTFVATYL